MATIDSSIALGVKPVQIEDPINRFARQQELSVNMMKGQEMQRGMQEEEEVRNFLRNADLSKPETRAQLSQFGKTGLGYGKLLAEQEKAGLETKKTNLEINEKTLKAHHERMSDLALNPSPENMTAHIQDGILRGDITPQQGEMTLKQTLAMPFEQRKQYFLQMGADANKRLTDVTTRRGQDMQRIPVGYRQNAAGELEAIPGGPTTTNLSPKEMQVREAKYPQATLAVKSFEAKTGELEKDLIALRNHPGLSSITGIVAGRAPALTKDGRAAQALYDKILARGGFKELQDMRAASPTGGALGNVSNQEGTQLRQSFAAIDRVQDAGDVQKAIDSAITDLQGSKSRVREAYDMTYDYKAPAPSGGAAPAPAAPAPAAPAPAAGGNTVTIPGGKILTFPTPEAAAAYKKAAGL